MGDGGRIRREHLAVGAIYGTVVYVTILVLLEEDRTDPEDAVAILVGTALVFWLAHVYAHLVPQIAAEGRLRTGRFMETAGDQVGILAAVAIPLIPLDPRDAGPAGQPTGIAGGDRRWRPVACRVRRPGSTGSGARLVASLWIAMVLLAAGIGLLWLEVSLH
jgi:hypothetical protein